MEELLQQWQTGLRQPDLEARAAAQRRWDSIAKPLGSLGALEKLIMDMAALMEEVTAEEVTEIARGVELDAVYFLKGESPE